MKNRCIFIFVMSQCMACNPCHDGTYHYNTIIRILDSKENPMQNIKVVVEYSDEERRFVNLVCDVNEEAEECSTTDKEGFANPTVATGEPWGHCPRDDKVDPPPRPDMLYPWVEYPEGNWTMYEIQISEDNIIKEGTTWLTIDLGTLTINIEEETDGTADAGVDTSSI